MKQHAIQNIQSTLLPLPGSDIDTDQIIPARFLRCVTFDDLGPGLFYDARHTPDGSQITSHPFNDPRYLGAQILMTGDNFGCGSSREHAPQALLKHGIRAIIAGSFAEIFFSNCTTIGIPCLTLDAAGREAVRQILATTPQAPAEIHLESCYLEIAGQKFALGLKSSVQQAFLTGSYDPLDELLSQQAAVANLAQKLGYISL